MLTQYLTTSNCDNYTVNYIVVESLTIKHISGYVTLIVSLKMSKRDRVFLTQIYNAINNNLPRNAANVCNHVMLPGLKVNFILNYLTTYITNRRFQFNKVFNSILIKSRNTPSNLNTKLPHTLLHQWKLIKQFLKRKSHLPTKTNINFLKKQKMHHILTRKHILKNNTTRKQLIIKITRNNKYNVRKKRHAIQLEKLTKKWEITPTALWTKSTFTQTVVAGQLQLKYAAMRQYSANKNKKQGFYALRKYLRTQPQFDYKLPTYILASKNTNRLYNIQKRIYSTPCGIDNNYIFVPDQAQGSHFKYIQCDIKKNINHLNKMNIHETHNVYIIYSKNQYLQPKMSNYTSRELKQIFFNHLFKTNNSIQLNTTQPRTYFSLTTPLILREFVISKTNRTVFDNLHKSLNNQIVTPNDGFSKLLTPSILKYTISTKLINNYIPLYFFKNADTRNKTTQYYNTFGVLNTRKYKIFFIFYLLNFLENFTKKRIWIRLNTLDHFSNTWKKYIIQFCKSNNHLYRRFNRLISIRELLEIIIIVAKTHDLQIFLMFIKRKFENAHFKKHKKILSILFDLLRKNRNIFYMLGIKGFFFDIRGKVGVSGNAKKRHLCFSLGKISTTTQKIKSHWQQISVWTPTGQMGITCYIQY